MQKFKNGCKKNAPALLGYIQAKTKGHDKKRVQKCKLHFAAIYRCLRGTGAKVQKF